jgi:hypothetical protein
VNVLDGWDPPPEKKGPDGGQAIRAKQAAGSGQASAHSIAATHTAASRQTEEA